MEINISLKQLMQLFGQDAANETVPPAVRSFAAKLMVLTAHVRRVEVLATKALADHDVKIKGFDKQLGEVVELVSPLVPKAPSEPASPAPDNVTTSAGPPNHNAPTAEELDNISAEDLVAQMQREADEMVTKTNAGGSVTPLPKVRQFGGGGKPTAASAPDKPGAA